MACFPGSPEDHRVQLGRASPFETAGGRKAPWRGVRHKGPRVPTGGHRGGPNRGRHRDGGADAGGLHRGCQEAHGSVGRDDRQEPRRKEARVAAQVLPVPSAGTLGADHHLRLQLQDTDSRDGGGRDQDPGWRESLDLHPEAWLDRASEAAFGNDLQRRSELPRG